MNLIRSAIPVGLILTILSGGCSANRPLKETTLVDKAVRYTAAFKRDMRLGRYQLALSDARRALEIYRILDRDDRIALSLNNLGTVQERLGMVGKAADSYNEAIEISRKSGTARTLAASLNNMAGMIAETDPENARLLAGEAHEIGLRRSWEDVMARALHTRARAALGSGSLDEGRDWCDKALNLASKADQKSTVAASLVTMGMIESLAGNTTAAVKSVEKALVIDRQLSDPYAIAMDYTRLAEIQNRAGDLKGAATSKKKADRILHLLGTGSDVREGDGLTVK